MCQKCDKAYIKYQEKRDKTTNKLWRKFQKVQNRCPAVIQQRKINEERQAKFRGDAWRFIPNVCSVCGKATNVSENGVLICSECKRKSKKAVMRDGYD
jgi:ribosomal protein S8